MIHFYAVDCQERIVFVKALNRYKEKGNVLENKHIRNKIATAAVATY